MGGSFERINDTAQQARLRQRAKILLSFELLMRKRENQDTTWFPKWLLLFTPIDALDDDEVDGAHTRAQRIEELIKSYTAGLDRQQAQLDRQQAHMNAQAHKLHELIALVKTHTTEQTQKMDEQTQKMDKLSRMVEKLVERIP
jgi:hypothetical protein